MFDDYITNTYQAVYFILNLSTKIEKNWLKHPVHLLKYILVAHKTKFMLAQKK